GGILIHGENYQALRLLERKYAGAVKCIYIDPPYNSGATEILYKNNYKHSSWLALMSGRVRLSKKLLSDDGSMVVAIDENEHVNLGNLLSEEFGCSHDIVCVTVVHNPRGIQGSNFSYTHEYAYFVFPSGGQYIRPRGVPKEEWEFSNLRNWGGESERHYGRNCFYPIYVRDGQIIGLGEVPPDDFHPGERVRVLDDGSYEVWPIDRAGTERKW